MDLGGTNCKKYTLYLVVSKKETSLNCALCDYKSIEVGQILVTLTIFSSLPESDTSCLGMTSIDKN
jgi:hypothetical protein